VTPGISMISRKVYILYVQVIVHRDKLRINNQQDASITCHTIREQQINTRCNVTSSNLTLLSSGHISLYVNKHFIISRRTYRIIWNSTWFYCFNIGIAYCNLLQNFNTVYTLTGKPEGKRPLGRPRRRCEDNTKMDLQEVGGGCEEWTELDQDRDRWRALVSAVMNLQVL
jgi:hypothetical protein